jgi:hypothetical protein
MGDCPDVPESNSFVPGSAQHLSAQYTLAKLCTCDKTLVGACQYPAGYTCAVSGDACDVSGQYFTAAQLEADPSAPTCYLCAPFGKSNFGKYQARGRSRREKSIIATSAIFVIFVLLAGFCLWRKMCCRKGVSEELDARTDMSEKPVKVETAEFSTDSPNLNPII